MTHTGDIERLLRTGERLRARLLEVKQLESAAGYVRLAIVVPKYGFTIVRRNKLKRRLRELCRLHLLRRQGSADVVVRARRESYAASFDELRVDVENIAAQLG